MVEAVRGMSVVSAAPGVSGGERRGHGNQKQKKEKKREAGRYV